jgi:predicted transglutaminase-like cysteine proteinase
MLTLTPELRAQLEQVQTEVNADTRYVSDMELYGREDFWTVAQGAGDCEDFSLAKRAKLLALDWPVDALRLAVCRTETGDLHAVLTVDCDDGTWVLDNRQTDVVAWDQLPYQWIERQAAGGPGWVLISST